MNGRVAEQEPGPPARTRLISNRQILISITGRRISNVQARQVGATPCQRRDHIASVHALNARLALDAYEPWPAPEMAKVDDSSSLSASTGAGPGTC
jgi:hypothetical protein